MTRKFNHICIIGDGAAGWLAYHSLKNFPGIEKITIIGSPSISKIGVGESTTLAFKRWLFNLNLSEHDFKKFLLDIDAAVKYGVSYEGWSPKTFLHHFSPLVKPKNSLYTERELTTFRQYKLGAKPTNISYNETSVPLAKYIYENKVYISDKGWGLDQDLQNNSFHFDAAKFIKACHNLAKNDKQLNYIPDTVRDAVYNGEIVERVILESEREITADYYISCIGQTAFNQKVFREEYISYDDYLLTNKALFSPIEYKDSVSEFHPYTIARTMPSGWRWITPTRSRIGTGYVFSDNHVSIDEAVNQLRIDAGIPNLEPFVVDFWPRRVKKVFKPNMCTLGMASGFQEPLDAPGLTLTTFSIHHLKNYFNQVIEPDANINKILDSFNKEAQHSYEFWCCFILHQYKTCTRSDTNFWKDHRQVNFDLYNTYISELFDDPMFEIQDDHLHYKERFIENSFSLFLKNCETWMFYNTTSGKDINWRVPGYEQDINNFLQSPNIDRSRIITHREFFNRMIKNVYGDNI